MEFKRAVVSSGVNIEKRKFTWRVNNFNHVRHSEQFIEAQQFKFTAGDTINLKTEWKFYMQVSPKKDKDDDQEKESIGMHLRCTKRPEGVKEVYADFQFSLIPEENHQSRTIKFGNLNGPLSDFAGNNAWGFPRVFKKDADLSELPLIDGCLVVDIEFHLYGATDSPALITSIPNEAGHAEAEFKQKFMEKLQSDFDKLGTDKYAFSEGKIRIISKDGGEFIGNKAILSVRSPVFEKMLGTAMEEANSGVIRIAELSSKTIAVLLQFTNTGTLHEEWSNPEVIGQLVYAAGKYQLPDLLEFLNNVLGNVCSKETCGKLLSLANMLGMKKAEKEVFEWIKMNISSSEEMVALIRQGSEADIL